MLVIFFRIILTWFSGINTGRFGEILVKITDPYLAWFRRFTFLRLGNLDLSPIAAIGVLTLVSRILGTLAVYGKISVGLMLALVLQAIWGAVAFILGFLIIVLILRLAAHLLAQNSYNPFWRIVDTISGPIIYRINRIFFKNRIVNYLMSLLISIAGMVLIYLILRSLVKILSGMLASLPF